MQLQLNFEVEPYKPCTHPLFNHLPWSGPMPLLLKGQRKGLYFLFSGNQLVYIGKSENILNRLYWHKHKKKEFDTVRVLPYLEFEGQYIRVFKPVLNRYFSRG